VLASYGDGPLAGQPALTRNGRAWYVGTRLADADLRGLLASVCADAGASAALPDPPAGLEVVRRSAPDGTGYLFLINHSSDSIELELAGTDLLTGERHDPVRVPDSGVVVLRTDA
jgi:beta-galactosidase